MKSFVNEPLPTFHFLHFRAWLNLDRYFEWRTNGGKKRLALMRIVINASMPPQLLIDNPEHGAPFGCICNL